MAPKQPHDNGLRVQVLAMFQDGKSIDDIIKTIKYSRSTIFAIRRKAKERGYDLELDSRIFLKYVEDVPHLGRPMKATLEVEEQVI